jgi:hypothetical protein
MKKKELKLKFEFDFKPKLEFGFYNPHQTTLGIESNSEISAKQTRKRTTQTQVQVLEP